MAAGMRKPSRRLGKQACRAGAPTASSDDADALSLQEIYEKMIPSVVSIVTNAGTGTGILAILCRMKGASSVLAYDIDERSVANTLDNMALNHCTAINVKLGDSRILEDEAADYDLLIANINRNILLHDMPVFRRTLKRGGRMLLSGFYLQDADAICHSAEELGLHTVKQDSHNQWTAILFETDAAGGMDV